MYAADKECKRKIKDRNGRAWGYFTLKEAEERGMENRDVLGDVFRRTKEKPVTQLLSADGQAEAEIYPYKRKLGFLEKEKGYIPCARDGETVAYARVVKRSLKRALLPLILLLLIAAGGLFWYLGKDKGPALDERAIAYQLPGGMKNSDPNNILYPAFESIDVESDGKVHTALVNVEGNPAYLKYKMVLSETGEILYETDYLEPGTAVVEFNLNRKLEPGTYDVRFEIDAGSLSDYTKALNGGVVETTLKVE